MSCGENCECGDDCGCGSSKMDDFSMKLNKIAIAKQNVDTLSALLSHLPEATSELKKDAEEALGANVKCLKEIENL